MVFFYVLDELLIYILIGDPGLPFRVLTHAALAPRKSAFARESPMHTLTSQDTHNKRSPDKEIRRESRLERKWENSLIMYSRLHEEPRQHRLRLSLNFLRVKVILTLSIQGNKRLSIMPKDSWMGFRIMLQTSKGLLYRLIPPRGIQDLIFIQALVNERIPMNSTPKASKRTGSHSNVYQTMPFTLAGTRHNCVLPTWFPTSYSLSPTSHSTECSEICIPCYQDLLGWISITPSVCLC